MLFQGFLYWLIPAEALGPVGWENFRPVGLAVE